MRDLTIRCGQFSLEGVSFEVEAGEYATLMGKTGSGKTTLIEAICGLRPILSGCILLNGRDVTRLKPAQREVGYVPQDGALFSTMTVRQHLGFALMIRKRKKGEMERRVAELAELLGLAHLLERLPAGLSGGESQRVALGRALSASPGVLCLDEPLSALDETTREEMYTLLKIARDETGVTALHITHSQHESDRLADRVLRLNEGRVTSVPPADPRSIADLPASDRPESMAYQAKETQ
ncbi:MAG: ABC transporter ATP-binding protein [Pirellulaceae bacterium]